MPVSGFPDVPSADWLRGSLRKAGEAGRQWPQTAFHPRPPAFFCPHVRSKTWPLNPYGPLPARCAGTPLLRKFPDAGSEEAHAMLTATTAGLAGRRPKPSAAALAELVQRQDSLLKPVTS